VTTAGPKPLVAAQAAKRKLAEAFRGESWFRGVGLAPANRRDLFTLRLTVDPSAHDEPSLPTECEGIPVEVVFLAAYRPRAGGSGNS